MSSDVEGGFQIMECVDHCICMSVYTSLNVFLSGIG